MSWFKRDEPNTGSAAIEAYKEYMNRIARQHYEMLKREEEERYRYTEELMVYGTVVRRGERMVLYDEMFLPAKKSIDPNQMFRKKKGM